MDKNIDTLIKQLEKHPQNREQILIQMDRAIHEYFDAKLKESDGVITTEMLEVANQLYDLPVVQILADALHVKLGRLQKMLGRKRQLVCSGCHNTFEVVEERRKYGYTNYRRDCQNCRTKSAEIRREKTNKEIEWEDYLLEIGEYISFLPMEAALGITSLRQKLLSYGDYWVNVNPVWPTYSQNFSEEDTFGMGCMICNALPVNLYVTRINTIPPQSFIEKMRDYREYRSTMFVRLAHRRRWPPATNVLQLLWQMDSGSYFYHASSIPLRLLPLLLICPDDEHVVIDTHFIPYPEVLFFRLKGIQ